MEYVTYENDFLNQLFKMLENKQISTFLSMKDKIVKELTIDERKEFLIEVIYYIFDKVDEDNFIKIIDVIIGNDLIINCNIDEWAPSLLALIIYTKPSLKIFKYLVEQKGGDINFVADAYAFYTEKEIEQEGYDPDYPRHQTCLDFLKIKRYDIWVMGYNDAEIQLKECDELEKYFKQIGGKYHSFHQK